MALDLVATWLPTLLGGILGAACGYLGGLGAGKSLRGRVRALDVDVSQLGESVAREAKKRASEAGVRAREEARSMKELQAEASRRLAEDAAPKRPRAGFGRH